MRDLPFADAPFLSSMAMVEFTVILVIALAAIAILLLILVLS